ncbi:hypothetical protein BGZ46_009587 [Entomortierella lignicola]|nr:hypothetical protein BGZ46_009587 [Entomortierella lignicola]
MRFSEEEITWVQQISAEGPNSYFDIFGIEDKQRGYLRYIRLIQNANISDDLQKQLLSEFEVWKVDKAPQYWLSRRAKLSSVNTATKLIEGSEPFAENAITGAAAQERSSETPKMGYFPSPRPRSAGSPCPAPLHSVPTSRLAKILDEDEENISSDSTHSEDGIQPILWPLGSNVTSGEERIEEGQNPFMSMPTTPKRSVIAVSQDIRPNLDQFKKLNQETEWIFNGVDVVDKFYIFRNENDKDFSVARDGIANLSQGSDFEKSLPTQIRPALSLSGTSAVDVDQKCPTLQMVFDRVSHYFKFNNKIPQDLNEREAFVSFTWCFLRGALTMMDIESRSLEVLVTGVEERKNNHKDLRFETKVQGQYADGIGFKESNQIYLAEAARLHQPKEEKQSEDEYKLARAMRDSWISQLKAACRDSVPCRGMSVYGSSSHKDETKIWLMDFRGMFRLFQIDSFLIPQDKSDFGRNMKGAAMSCIELAIRIRDELQRRGTEKVQASYPMRVEFNNAIQEIQSTSATPEKPKKRKTE